MFDKIKGKVANATGGGDVGALKQHLQGINFPASKDEILSQMQSNGADEGLLAKVRNIAQDHFSDQNDLLSKFTSK